MFWVEMSNRSVSPWGINKRTMALKFLILGPQFWSQDKVELDKLYIDRYIYESITKG